MEEKADADILLGFAKLFAKHLGKKHEVIVVHPDQVAILDIVDDSLGEEPVDFLVGGPGGLVESDLTGVVVKKRPEN